MLMTLLPTLITIVLVIPPPNWTALDYNLYLSHRAAQAPWEGGLCWNAEFILREHVVHVTSAKWNGDGQGQGSGGGGGARTAARRRVMELGAGTRL